MCSHLLNLLNVGVESEQSADEKAHEHTSIKRVYERLISCYIFSHEFQAARCQNEIMQHLQRFHRALHVSKVVGRSFPCLSLVDFAFIRTGEVSAILRWFAACFGQHGHEQPLCNELNLKNGSSQFLAAMVALIFADRKDKYNQDRC